MIAPGIFHGRCRPVHLEHDFLCSAANGEIAGDFELTGSDLLDLLGLESHGGVVRDVKELVAAQVVVAVRLASIHGGYVNGHVDGGLGDVLIVQHDRAGNLAESSAHGRNGQMADGKLRGRMLRINLPFGSGCSGGQRKSGYESGGYCDSR